MNTTCTESYCPNIPGTILNNQRIQDAIKHIIANNGGQDVTVSISSDGKTYNISTHLINNSSILSINNTSSNVQSSRAPFFHVPNPPSPSYFTASLFGGNIKFDYSDNILYTSNVISYEIVKSNSVNGTYTLDHIDTYGSLPLGPISQTSYSGCMATSGYSSNTTYYFKIRVILDGLPSDFTSSPVYITTPNTLPGC